MSSDTVIELSRVGLCYRRHRRAFNLGGDEHWPLRDVSFTLRRGESLGIIGRNGTGKSTLLQVLAGIIEPDRGSITFHDVRVSLLALNVGFVPELSGRENAILSGRLLGIPRAEMMRRLPEIVEFAELDDFIDDPVGIYSSGMVVRLGFSVAIHARAEVLLIDEVLGVGDLEFQAKSGRAIEEIIRSDQTVVLVSHSPLPIESLCSQAIWIDEGVVKAEGEPCPVLDAYRGSLDLTAGPASRTTA